MHCPKKGPYYTPSLKEVKLGTKKHIWETNFFLQDSMRLRRFQNFKKIHLSIFSELIALAYANQEQPRKICRVDFLEIYYPSKTY